MSLPAYMFLYDENGVLMQGACEASGRIGATEISTSQFGVSQGMDSFTGRFSGRVSMNPLHSAKRLTN